MDDEVRRLWRAHVKARFTLAADAEHLSPGEFAAIMREGEMRANELITNLMRVAAGRGESVQELLADPVVREQLRTVGADAAGGVFDDDALDRELGALSWLT
ncbi:hypothetical protein [Kutzneria sp. NPDC051319]|uniref:hypothetical protein n=1 Tax=Kutzneria sp. NPDC051319 TaxID=3155047 RepID=UPI00342A82A3